MPKGISFLFLFFILSVSAVADEVGEAAWVMNDRRTPEAIARDTTLENLARKRIEDKHHKEAQKVSVTVFNGTVLITGIVRDETVRMDIEQLVGSLPNIKGIANELVVEPAGGPAHDVGDEQIAANIARRFRSSPTLQSDPVRIVIGNRVVYLMGLVTHAEADAAAELAATTRRVEKVVRVFEYLD